MDNQWIMPDVHEVKITYGPPFRTQPGSAHPGRVTNPTTPGHPLPSGPRTVSLPTTPAAPPGHFG